MVDGIQFARDRIALLEAEIDRLNEFIRQSEKLFTDGWLGPVGAVEPNDQGTKMADRSAPVGEHSGTARKNGAVEDDEDSLALEPKTDESVGASLAKKNRPEPDRKSIFKRANS